MRRTSRTSSPVTAWSTRCCRRRASKSGQWQSAESRARRSACGRVRVGERPAAMMHRACAWFSSSLGTWSGQLRVLVVWWSLWTLADTYLIPYTPQSELLLLGVVVLSYAASRVVRSVWGRASECGARCSGQAQAWLSRATQTAPAGQRYGTQRDFL